MDCRTKEERGLEPLQNDKFVIKKSRYDSIDSYLSPQGDKFNDVPLVYDPKVYQQLIDNDIDHLLAQHIAHLFIRDSVSLFSEKVHQNDEEDTDHFEVIVATEGNYSFLIFIFFTIQEYTINQLANHAIQTPTTKFNHWVEGRIQTM